MTGPRIASLDFTRGIAVMGILTMNIIGFAMIDAAYFNPRAQGGATGLDLAAYLINFVLFDGKMRGLFSFLFGASMLLVIDRAGAKGEDPARVHYARMAWLLVFGLAHLYLVWWGDILSHYALVGMIAFAFREQPIRRLLIWGVALLAVQTLLMAGLPFAVAMAQADLDVPARAAAAQTALDGFAQQFGIPDAAHAARQTAIYRDGGYGAILAYRMDKALWSPLSSLFFIGVETLAYMLFGMAAYRSGLLTGGWDRRRYARWALAGLAIGVPAYSAIAAWLVASDFSLIAVVGGVMTLTVPARPAMIVGWACLLILLIRPGGALTARIAAAGRMAFTNYLLTSLICTTIFYGYGGGWFGTLSRAEVYLVVAGIWIAMLLWSKPWLDRFAYGPLEWGWRSLARWRRQPMLRENRS